ncbi:MAG: D-glycero-beta-D-manno-heptose 1-phosphate adenylyltransferase [Pirellulales bacterium]|nr:D-glycero-beta-D-manno-heptose 1-phosphate adenylyltransferase [Pirellulales bacterium]
MISQDLLPILDSLGHPRVLVLGDLILDRYTWGNAERVSQEAPVILLRADHREVRLGGAANVCQMLRGLEAEVTCAGVVGVDADGAEVRQILREAGVDESAVLFDKHRPTTVKERFIGRAANRHPHQILRVDTEERMPLSPELTHQFAEEIKERLGDFDIVLISDYDKGVCTPELLQTVIRAASEQSVPVAVDPIRGSDYSRYRGATLMTPNRYETELATGLAVNSVDDAFTAGEELCRRYDLQHAIVTLDKDGMVLTSQGIDDTGEQNFQHAHFPTRPRSVYDITGAGDIVLAMIGLCVADGISLPHAVPLANVAGGLEVEHVGVAPVPRQDIRLDLLRNLPDGSVRKVITAEDAVRIAETAREKGNRVVFTNGCFDILHVGHVTYLEEAKAQGDLLILGLNSDASVSGLKGPTRPVRKQAERAAVLAALSYVDYIVIFDEPTPIALIESIRPEVLVKGGDYRNKQHQITGKEFVENYGGRLHLAGLVEGVSTTAILKSVAA